jgi:signal transduction histidine kinase
VAVIGLGGMALLVEPVGDEPRWAHFLYLSWWILAFLVGKAIRDRRELLAGLRERNRHLEETREEEARRRVAEERVRIARDLHDIVAHNIAGISLQAATGAHVADAHPDQARQALVAIRQASRQTLDELRSTLHLLREGDDAAPLAPTPGLEELDGLVDFVTRSGVPVDLERRGSTAEVTEAVGCAAFRIVQESLTNVMRHAGPARATVVIERTPTGLRVHVVDDGRGAAAVTEVEGLRPGHGISGMHERAQAVGGTVAAGPRPGGGFTVEAHLPMTAREGEPVGGDTADGSHDLPTAEPRPAEPRPAEPRPADPRGVRA